MSPLYDYECRHCKVVILDRLESIKAESIQDCPKCGHEQELYRIISAPSQIAFAGGGWYAQGYSS